MCEPTETPTDIWIDRKIAEDYDLIEQSVNISDVVALTILWWKDEAQVKYLRQSRKLKKCDKHWNNTGMEKQKASEATGLYFIWRRR